MNNRYETAGEIHKRARSLLDSQGLVDLYAPGIRSVEEADRIVSRRGTVGIVFIVSIAIAVALWMAVYCRG
jgi:hypothetical protein